MRTVVLILPAKPTPLVPGISVLRALPRRELRRVGPFVFFDHFGPEAPVMDVPAHPHVGLQTVTYLFSERFATAIRSATSRSSARAK